MERLVKIKKTNYLLYLLNTIDTDRIKIITPKNSGCQLSIRVINGNKKLFKDISKWVIKTVGENQIIRTAGSLHNFWIFTSFIRFKISLNEKRSDYSWLG